MATTPRDIQDQVTHWLQSRAGARFGTSYGSSLNERLMEPMVGGGIEAEIDKLRRDVPVTSRASVDVWHSPTAADKTDVTITVDDVAVSNAQARESVMPQPMPAAAVVFSPGSFSLTANSLGVWDGQPAFVDVLVSWNGADVTGEASFAVADGPGVVTSRTGNRITLVSVSSAVQSSYIDVTVAGPEGSPVTRRFNINKVSIGGSAPPPGSTRPDAPWGLEMFAFTQTSVSLRWFPPLNDGGAPILDYVAYYRTAAGSWVEFIDAVTPSVRQTTVTGLAIDTEYEFRVAAINAAGVGDPSLVVTVTTAPAEVTFASPPATVYVDALNETTLNVGFPYPESDGGAAITDYVIQYRQDGQPSWTTLVDGVNTFLGSIVIAGLLPATLYWVRVASVNAAGQGAWSPEVSRATASPATAPGAPTGLAASAVTSSGLTLSFSAPASDGGATITDYRVYKRKQPATDWSYNGSTSLALSAAISGLDPGGTYDFYAVAVNSVGEGAPSAIFTQALPAGTSTTKLLALFNGANGSTALVDSSSSPLTMTAHGSASLSTAQARFGSASLGLDGSGARASVTYAAGVDLSSGDFTVQVSARFGNGGERMVINSGAGTGYYPWQIYKEAGEKISARGFTSGGPALWSISGSLVASLNTWYDIALVRSGDTMTLYVNGSSVGSAALPSGATLYASAANLSIGAWDTGQWPISGYVDHLRIKKGDAIAIAPLTAEFTG